MAKGIVKWKTKIELDIADLIKSLEDAESRLDSLEKEPHKVKLDLDTKLLENTLNKLNKMLSSLGKGTGNFKELESLSIKLQKTSTDIEKISKSLSQLDGKGVSNLLTAINNIDSSLTTLTAHITGVSKNMNDVGNSAKNVDDIARSADKATQSMENLASAQDKVSNNKTGQETKKPSSSAVSGKNDQYAQIRKESSARKKESENQRKSSVNQALKDQLSAYKKIQDIREKISKNSGNTQLVSELERQKKVYQEQYLSATKILKANSDLYDSEKRLNEIKKIGLETTFKINEYELKKQENIISSVVSGKNDLYISNGINFLSKYQGQSSPELISARQYLEQIKTLTNEINALAVKKTSGEIIDTNRLIEASNQLEQYKARFKNVTEEIKLLETKTLAPGVAQTSSNQVQEYISKNTKAWKKYKVELEAIRDEYKKITTEGQKLDLDNQFKALKTKISAEGLTGKSFLGETIADVEKLSKFVGAYNIGQMLMQETPRQVVNAVREINTAQIELTKVSSASSSELSSYWGEAAESAKKYGSTISEVIQSTADWSRLGYGLNDAKQLSDMTTLLTRIGDNMTQESSSEGLISTLRGFELETDKAQNIVDVANQIANTQPIDTSGIFEVMQRSASSLNAAGNTYEQAVSMATAANGTVQNSEKVGTALKTISMRIRGAETDLEGAAIDTEGMASSTAKLREEIIALSGVDIMIDDNSFKSTYSILDELAEKWQDLTDIQQASITELIAGKNQGNVMSSLMSNWDIAETSLNTALNESDGSAERELENWNKGIDASVEHFKASFQSISMSALDSSIVKGIVDSGTAILDILEGIGNALGSIGTSVAIFGGIKLFKNLD